MPSPSPSAPASAAISRADSVSMSVDAAPPKKEEEDGPDLFADMAAPCVSAAGASRAHSPKHELFKAEPVNAPVKAESVKAETGSGAATPARSGPQLIGDLPLATDAALATFELLADNHYQYQTLGRSREAMEGMACDCTYAPGAPPRLHT
jgi:hypothetical protein